MFNNSYDYLVFLNVNIDLIIFFNFIYYINLSSILYIWFFNFVIFILVLILGIIFVFEVVFEFFFFGYVRCRIVLEFFFIVDFLRVENDVD